ncbi:MAG: hypothetical protein KAW47_07785 [Thermoplasmatales archaeon]|nr:hypothetical protein [Thermoplasmatales archaeon]
MKYHGIEFDNETKMSGVLRLGMLRFLEILYVEFHFTPTFSPKEAPEWPERWIDGKFRGAVDKLKDTFMKFDTIARYLSQSIDLALANKDSREMSQYGHFLKAMKDIPIYLDSLLLYLRMQADCLANVIPNLYGEEGRRQSIARDSFRDQTKWFIKKKPGFDPAYTKILGENTEWFEMLAGKSRGQGLRDILVHYRGVYQLGWTALSTGETISFNASLLNESGYVEDSLIPTLTAIVAGYFEFIEKAYVHFRGLVLEKVEGGSFGDIYESAQLLKFNAGLGSAWIYPKIEVEANKANAPDSSSR